MNEYEPNLDPVPPLPISEDSGVGTDLWFGRRLAKEHGTDLKYVRAWKQWIIYDPGQGRWIRDDTDAEWSCAKVTIQRLVTEAGKLAFSDESRAKMLNKAAGKYMATSAMAGALLAARSEEAVKARTTDWDAPAHLLNCGNGTVDLRTGELSPHRREDRLTKTTDIKYDASAAAPQFQKFLERILPDAEMREYVQRAVGYSAIGSVTEQVLFVAWGGGANGKSVLFGAVSAALGEYAIGVPTELLVATKHPDHPTVKTVLRGARFALASEAPEEGGFNEAQVKALTGGDKISARGMRENFYEFDPSHTLWLQTNHQPSVRETTLAFWRRIRMIPFLVTIPKDEQDKELAGKLEVELPGILRWVVDGAVAYLREGMREPAAVLAATAEYQADQDPFREFMDMFEPGGYMPSCDIYPIYTAWATRQYIKPLRPKGLSARLKKRGWQPKQPPGGDRGFAVKLRPEGTQEKSKVDSQSTSPYDLYVGSLRGNIGKTSTQIDFDSAGLSSSGSAGSRESTMSFEDDESLGNMADEASD